MRADAAMGPDEEFKSLASRVFVVKDWILQIGGHS
jgi:hypothetical protein